MASRILPLSLALILMVLVGTSQGFGAHNCCVDYTTKTLRLHMIEGFYVQDSGGVCNLNAVIFAVRHPCSSRGTAPIEVCADPTKEWVKQLIAKFSKVTIQGKRANRKKSRKQCKRQRKSYG
ncbi:C-C motif chemokine 20-like [Mixophyes fleayi]|uniref:C-C motif chemokine 20-like n=1 Tax=Mixophyes fleayi TaxID=3061075 RepID=UPI003F4DBD32